MSELLSLASCAKVFGMDVLGRRLADPFDAFWEQYGPEISASVEHIEEGHSSVFGDLGADRSAPDEPAWAGLPGDDLAYHVAHELAHLLLRARSYPIVAPGSDIPPGSEAARVGGDLQEMIDHAALSEILGPFGFRNDFILDRTAGGGLRGACRPAPSRSPARPGSRRGRYATVNFRGTWDQSGGRPSKPCTGSGRQTRRSWASGSSP